jgi:4-hydroxy-4-methyl-2-oxoglutarate aldolase
MALAIRNPRRTERRLVDGFAAHGVATVHEAQGRTGLMAPYMRPIYPGAHVSGSALTVNVPPGDNWMIHVAVELCQFGDIVVVAPTTPVDAGYFGELLATAMQARGVRGLVIDSGCRDVAALRDMGFPVWSRCVTAAGTVKETLGDVNVPLVCAGQRVAPGDVVVADDDGVVVVDRRRAPEVLDACARRAQNEDANRKRYQAGELSLDLYGMRAELAEKGLVYSDDPLHE